MQQLEDKFCILSDLRSIHGAHLVDSGQKLSRTAFLWACWSVRSNQFQNEQK